MNLRWRIRTALLSAAKGSLCISFLPTINVMLVFCWAALFKAGTARERIDVVKEMVPLILFWPAAIGLVTLATTILFILPYISLVNVQGLLKRPWRIFVESAALVTVAMVGMTSAMETPSVSLWDRGLGTFLDFAWMTSTLSSAFFLRSAKKQARIPEVRKVQPYSGLRRDGGC